jgi:DNA-binding CsgD family transcriptional regulator/tetratricopeptide (TPR) repeat protein
MPQEVVLDREHERTTLDDLLSAAMSGESNTLVIYGDAGMGKTALLDYARSTTSLPVVSIAGVESERSFGFAGLHRLLLPVLDGLAALPPIPQRMALEIAFGLADGPPPDRFIVGLASLTLLANKSDRSGLLCIIDDAQWIDSESLQALAFVGRRVRAEGIVLLFGIRTETNLPSDLAGIPSLEVVGLPERSSMELLQIASPHPVVESTTKRIFAETRGCPLALWEIGANLSDAQSQGVEGLGPPAAVGSRLEQHFLEQVGSLSKESQLFLLAAAADTSGDDALVRQAAQALGCGPDCEADAKRVRLLESGLEIKFRHPMIRSAVYVNANATQRREVHRVFGHLIEKTRYPDQWARHQVLAASGRDDVLAAEVEATAHLARARGGFAAEAALLVSAADLSETPATEAPRVLGAATAAMNAGAHKHAEELLDRARPHLLDPLRIAEAERLRGQLSIPLFQPPAAPSLLLNAARLFQPLDETKSRHVLLEAFAAYAISQDHTDKIDGLDIARVAVSTSASGGTRTLEDNLLDGTSKFFLEGSDAAYDDYRAAASVLRDGEVSVSQISNWATFGHWIADELLDDRTYNAWTARVAGSARENGALFAVLHSLFTQAEVDIRTGNLRSANGRYAEVLDVATAIGQPAAYYEATNIEALAWMGDDDGAKAAGSSLLEMASSVGAASEVFRAHRAMAVLHLGAGRYGEALRETEQILSNRAFGWVSQTLPIAIEAAVRSGEHELARDYASELELRATASGSPWGLGLMTLSYALLDAGDEAESLFNKAIALLGETTVRRDLANARLLYGEWLRRKNRRVDARAQLRTAHEFFVAMGASGFARRAEAELLATGERARRRTVETTDDLTPQERRVAELATEGLTNSEIAATLFISAATVEYHLTKVFRKFGIKSRVQLAKRL